MGSFLNVVIDRLPRGASLVYPPSHCDSCQRRLALRDLLPLLSYLGLRGRCRFCRAPIPARIFLVELITGTLFAMSVLRFGSTPESVAAALFTWVFLAVFFIDLEHGLVLDTVVYPAILLGLGLSLFSPAIEGGVLASLTSSGIGGLVGLGIMLAIFAAARGGMGGGDVKLGGLLGVVLGVPLTFVALLMAFVVGGLAAGVLLALRVKGRKDPIPFGPFLAGAGILALFYGLPIYDGYLDLLDWLGNLLWRFFL